VSPAVRVLLCFPLAPQQNDSLIPAISTGLLPPCHATCLMSLSLLASVTSSMSRLGYLPLLIEYFKTPWHFIL